MPSAKPLPAADIIRAAHARAYDLPIYIAISIFVSTILECP